MFILPSPSDISSKSTTDRRAQDASDTKNRSKHSGVIRSLLGLDNESDDCIGAWTDARRPNTGNDTTCNEDCWRRCHSTNKTAHFEDENGYQEAQFEGEVLVNLAPCRLTAASGQEEGGGVPGLVLDAVEVIGDGGDRGRDDGLWQLMSNGFLATSVEMTEKNIYETSPERGSTKKKEKRKKEHTMSRAIKKMLSIREIMLTQSAKPVIYCDSVCALSPFCSDVSTWLPSLISSLISSRDPGDSRSELSGEEEDGKLASG